MILRTQVRESEFLIFWNIILTLGLLLLFVQRMIGRKIRNFLFFDYVKTATLIPLNILAKSFSSLGRMISLGKGLTEGNRTSQITKGILITLPIVLFFFLLFSSADLAFKKLVADLFSFNFNIDPDLAAQIWLAIILGVIWLGSYVYILENVGKEEGGMPVTARRYKFGNIEAGILFTTLCLLFSAFVIIQIRYLFAGHDAITELGYTYAEYVHKGFGELIVVSLTTFGLIFLAERYIERVQSQPSVFFRVLSVILMVLVLIIMASAFMRLGVYEQAYGFTVLRVLVQAFIIWLAVIFLWLGYKIIVNVGDRPFIFGMFVSVVAFFILFNLFNPESFVTRKNIGQFANSMGLDTSYLSTLSADAVPALMPLLDLAHLNDKSGSPLPVETAGMLKHYYDTASGQSWQSYNVSRSQAIKLIESRWDQISSLAKDASVDTDKSLSEDGVTQEENVTNK